MSVNEMLMAAAGAGTSEFVEDVFSTWLYTGNGSTQTITNGIDLSGKGGMVWIKSRSAATNHFLFDTTRGVLNEVNSNTTDAQVSLANSLTAFNSNGFNLGSATGINVNVATYASWTFREAPKFFDVVTYTGNGANRTIAHNLGSVPGMIIVKRTDTTGDWQVYHRSLANTQYTVLNTTAAVATGATRWNSTTPTSTVFSLGTDATVNANAGTYVAYLFAHDAGGFGVSGADNVISCGSYTNSSSVTVGFEPQYIMLKRTDTTGDWRVFDAMRGLTVTTSNLLRPNTTEAEGSGWDIKPTATGFQPIDFSTGTYIYMAIRRPMKTPTTGTSVFTPAAVSSTAVRQSLSYPADLSIGKKRTDATNGFWFEDRLRGYALTNTTGRALESTLSDGETTANAPLVFNVTNDGLNYGDLVAQSSSIFYHFKRATGFFDIVCYEGTGSNRTVTHNLGVVPELIIVKSRGAAANDWAVYSAPVGNNRALFLNGAGAQSSTSAVYWNNTTPSSTTFTVGTTSEVNTNGVNYVAYLFATLAGVSKVGSYTGNGTSQTINCGFSGGARFVMIKRTDSSGDWFVWDTARGIVSGNDPYLRINLTNVENGNNDSIDPDSSGFIVNQESFASINVNTATYIYLAIA